MGNLELVIISIRSREAILLFAALLSSRSSFISLCIVCFCSAGPTYSSQISPTAWLLTIEPGKAGRGKLRVFNGCLDDMWASKEKRDDKTEKFRKIV